MKDILRSIWDVEQKQLSTTSETDEYWDKLNINFDLLLQWFFQQVKDNSQMPDVDFPFLDVPGS